MPPFLWDWVEKQLVITRVASSGSDLKPGDIVRTVNGLPAEEALNRVEETISAATLQWRRFRGLRLLAAGPPDSVLTLEVQSAAGESRGVRVKRTAKLGGVKEDRPDKVAEIKPGIWYLDLDRIVDADFT